MRPKKCSNKTETLGFEGKITSSKEYQLSLFSEMDPYYHYAVRSEHPQIGVEGLGGAATAVYPCLEIKNTKFCSL